MNPLFAPFRIKTLSLKNRIVMAPMTRLASPGGVPSREMTAYYERRARGGVGLIVSEGTVVDRPASATGWSGIPRFHGAVPLAGWRRTLERVHAAGAAMAPQIWHMGIQGENAGTEEAEGASAFYAPGRANGHAMTLADIDATVAAFAHSAAEAKRLGFDCVEIHGAHGYLIDQFFWAATNTREDAYGGTIGERTRFAAEIVAAIRRAVGDDFPILLRLSQWKEADYKARIAGSPRELAAWLEPLADAGVDVFDCSQRRYWEPAFDGSSLNFAGWTKKITGKPAITVGSVGLGDDNWGKPSIGPDRPADADTGHRALNDLLERLERGEFDLVALGRALISDPAWAEKVKAGREAELTGFSAEDLKRIA